MGDTLEFTCFITGKRFISGIPNGWDSWSTEKQRIFMAEIMLKDVELTTDYDTAMAEIMSQFEINVRQSVVAKGMNKAYKAAKRLLEDAEEFWGYGHKIVLRLRKHLIYWMTLMNTQREIIMKYETYWQNPNVMLGMCLILLMNSERYSSNRQWHSYGNG